MNKQGPNGIEWTDYTWNPIGGCFHECRWRMPDGALAVCYAETTANNVATAAYPHGFDFRYWRPQTLHEPGELRKPSRIFCGSMSDVFGHWVEAWQIRAVLDICRVNPEHTFQFLTKNPKRLHDFEFPSNCWIGVSVPPTFMWGKELTPEQQRRWFQVACEELAACDALVKWVSAEPLSFDVSWLYNHVNPAWLVIGAASRGKTYYQPKPEWVEALLSAAAAHNTSVFFKGNLKWEPRRASFPVVTMEQMTLL